MRSSPILDRTRDTVVRRAPGVRSSASQRYSERCVAPLASASAASSRRCAALGRSTTSPCSLTKHTAPSNRTKAVAIAWWTAPELTLGGFARLLGLDGFGRDAHAVHDPSPVDLDDLGRGELHARAVGVEHELVAHPVGGS